MNIAVNTRFLLPHKMEGFGWFTYEIVKRLVLSHPEHQFYFFFDRTFDPKFVFAENVIPVVLNPPARHPVLFKIWFDYSVTRALKKYKSDLFFSPDGYLSLKTNVKQIGVIHDLNFEHYPEDIPKWPRAYLKSNFRKFARKAAHIFTVSEYSKQDIVSLYNIEPEKITVSYNAASHHFKPVSEAIKTEIKVRYSSSEDYFVYVGAIHKRKNIDRLIAAFSQFKSATGSKTKLVIVGESLWANQEGAVEERDVSDIVFTGHVKIDQLAKIVGAAKALCLVSYFEGFGIPLVEAMQSGVPVLSGNLTSLPEVCGGAGVLVDPFSIDEITDGLSRLDSDDQLRSDLIPKGIERAKDFDWQKSADIIWEEIERLIKNH